MARAAARGRRDAVGPGGHPRDRQPPRLADDRRAHARRARRRSKRSPRRSRATGFARRRAARHGRLLAGTRGAAAHLRAEHVAAPALHVLDSTDAATIRAVEDAVDLQRTLFIVSSKSGGTIEPLSLFAHFFALVGDGSQLRRDHRPRLGPARSSPREHGFRATFAGDPDIGGRYSALSPFGIVPAALLGIDVRTLLDGRCRRLADASRTTQRRRLPLDHPGARLAGRRPQRARAGGPRQAHVRDLRVAARPRAVARAAGGRVDRQAGHGHPAGRRRAARRAGRSTAMTACSPTCPTLRTPDADARARGCERWPRPGTRVITIPTDGPGGPRARVPAGRARRRGRRLGPCRSTPSTSPTCSRPRTRPSACSTGFEAERASCPSAPSADAAALRSLLLERSAAGVRGDHGLRRALERVRRRRRRAARGDARGRRSRRPPSATARASCTRPASSTRAARGRDASCSCSTTARATSTIPGAPYTLHHAQERAGDRRPADTLRELGLPAERVRLEGEDPVGALRALTARIKECNVTQIGFVGLGKMGGNMVHRIRRDSEHEVVAFDFDEKAVKQAVKQRRRRRGLAEGARQAAAAAADGVDHGARPATPRRRRSTSSPSCSTAATRSSTAATRSGPTTSAAPQELQRQRHRLRRRRRLRRRLGPGGAATA